MFYGSIIVHAEQILATIFLAFFSIAKVFAKSVLSGSFGSFRKIEIFIKNRNFNRIFFRKRFHPWITVFLGKFYNKSKLQIFKHYLQHPVRDISTVFSCKISTFPISPVFVFLSKKVFPFEKLSVDLREVCSTKQTKKIFNIYFQPVWSRKGGKSWTQRKRLYHQPKYTNLKLQTPNVTRRLKMYEFPNPFIFVGHFFYCTQPKCIIEL